MDCQGPQVGVSLPLYAYVATSNTRATGKYCCLWCEDDYEEMQKPRDQRSPSRLSTLESLKRDHGDFLADSGNIKKAKLYHNCIRPHFFEIPLTGIYMYG